MPLLWESRNFYYAVSVLLGTIVGAGMFGLPYAFSQAGFGIGLLFLFLLTLATLTLHLAYGEVVLRTREKHRLVGYVAMYLGPRWKQITTIVAVLSMYGALLAYMILGGEFLDIIFPFVPSFTSFHFTLIFFIFASLGVFTDIRTVARIEFLMVFFLIGVILFLFLRSIPEIEPINFLGLAAKNAFLPYGVILFSLAGGAAIPELRDVIGGEGTKLKKVIVFGTLIPAVLYLIFAVSVVGTSGSGTSQEAFRGLFPWFGSFVMFIGALFGVVAVFTSFLIIGINLKKVFWYDYGVPKIVSWVLASGVPLILFVGGLQSFIRIIAIVGAVMGGIEGLLILAVHRKSKNAGDRSPEYSVTIPKILFWGICGMFIAGIIWQMIYFVQEYRS